jgi:hypothetical protein
MTPEQIAEELKKFNGEKVSNKVRLFSHYAEVFAIFAKYDKPDDWANVAPYHDEIYAGPDLKLVSKEDKKRIKELGWDVDRDSDCFHKSF